MCALNLTDQTNRELAAITKRIAELAAHADLSERLQKAENLRLPPSDAVVRWGPGPPPEELDIEKINDDMAAFGGDTRRAIASGMVNRFEEYLQNLIFYVVLARAAGPAGRVEQVSAITSHVHSKTKWLTPPGLLQRLASELDLGEEGLESDAGILLQINQMRRCLVHREGRVQEEDVDSSGILEIRWEKLQLFFAAADDPDSQMPISELPIRIEKDGSVQAGRREVTKTWKLGERVTLTASDCHDIAFALTMVAQTLATKVNDRIEALLGPGGTESRADDARGASK